VKKEKKFKCSDLEEWSFKQRQQLKVNHEKLFKRIADAPFGEKAKTPSKKMGSE